MIIADIIMSLYRRNANGGLNTPGGTRVRQAFKSPFRGNISSEASSNQQISPENSSKDLRTSCSALECKENSQMQNDRGKGSAHLTPRRHVLSKSHIARRTSQQGFSAPFRSPSRNTGQDQAQGSLDEQLATLKKQELELDNEITSLEELGLKTEELQVHIKNLHRYNEIKDAAQLVMGRLAELEGVTVKEMHEKYEISSSE